jgi:hypothetical protein
MSIKKTITGLTLSMLLGSELANADWGDVYYCQQTNNQLTALEGKQTSYILEKFQFKLDQTKNAMVFGNTGMFKGEVYKLTKDKNFPEQEFWYAYDEYSMTYFREGRFSYTQIGSNGATVVSADCDKF